MLHFSVQDVRRGGQSNEYLTKKNCKILKCMLNCTGSELRGHHKRSLFSLFGKQEQFNKLHCTRNTINSFRIDLAVCL